MAAKKITYKKAGVNIDEGNLFVKKIQPHLKKTISKNVIGDRTSFAALYSLDINKIKQPVLVSCTDGVGTKVQIGVSTNKIEGLGIDLVAMCINDLICTGAKPLFFLDYIATSKLNSSYGLNFFFSNLLLHLNFTFRNTFLDVITRSHLERGFDNRVTMILMQHSDFIFIR